MMRIPHIKKVVNEVKWGEIEIFECDGSVYVRYHNPVYKGSPFECPVCFSTSFTVEKILNSSEVITFLSRFD